MKKIDKKTWFALSFLIVIVALPVVTSALSLNIQDYPEIGGVDLDCLEVGTCPLSVGIIVIFIYNAAIWVGGVVAFITMVYAGFLYIFSGNAPGNRSKAKGMLTNVVWGISILLLSYITLVLINPDLVNLPETFLPEVQEKDVDFDIGNVDNKKSGDGSTGKEIIKTGSELDKCLSGGISIVECARPIAKNSLAECINPDNVAGTITACITNCTTLINTAIGSGFDATSLCNEVADGLILESKPDDPVDTIAQLENACINGIDGLPTGCTFSGTTCKATGTTQIIKCQESFEPVCEDDLGGTFTVTVSGDTSFMKCVLP